MSKEDESISPEEYGALMEKLTSVEEKIDKYETDGKVDEVVKGLVETIEKMAEEIKILKEVEPVDISKMATIEDSIKIEDFKKMTDVNKTILDRIEVIEKTPFFKGTKDGDPKGETNDGSLIDKIVGSQYGTGV